MDPEGFDPAEVYLPHSTALDAQACFERKAPGLERIGLANLEKAWLAHRPSLAREETMHPVRRLGWFWAWTQLRMLMACTIEASLGLVGDPLAARAVLGNVASAGGNDAASPDPASPS